MGINPFTTYLETFRLRTGLSRPELAFLLGAMDGKTVARHERAMRVPLLRTAVAYGIVLDVSFEELYEGLALEVQADLRSRARGLRRQIQRRPATARNLRKIEVLSRIAEDADRPRT